MVRERVHEGSRTLVVLWESVLARIRCMLGRKELPKAKAKPPPWDGGLQLGWAW